MTEFLQNNSHYDTQVLARDLHTDHGLQICYMLCNGGYPKGMAVSKKNSRLIY